MMIMMDDDDNDDDNDDDDCNDDDDDDDDDVDGDNDDCIDDVNGEGDGDGRWRRRWWSFLHMFEGESQYKTHDSLKEGMTNTSYQIHYFDMQNTTSIITASHITFRVREVNQNAIHWFGKY